MVWISNNEHYSSANDVTVKSLSSKVPQHNLLVCYTNNPKYSQVMGLGAMEGKQWNMWWWNVSTILAQVDVTPLLSHPYNCLDLAFYGLSDIQFPDTPAGGKLVLQLGIEQ